ncbi:MAG: hypothetical protein CVU10_02150 [Bacteroidetes bacterium HGW-Bacteroidetes-5]|nr:MAG: hypothetical protein CVU10_02150 [Bacteroidetes bacterium HGW-Bacteroidetes-5]
MATLNINGFYDHLLALIGNMVNEHFLKEANMNMILVSDNSHTWNFLPFIIVKGYTNIYTHKLHFN